MNGSFFIQNDQNIKNTRQLRLSCIYGADKRIRTSMKLPSHGPEPCASANSAISADGSLSFNSSDSFIILHFRIYARYILLYFIFLADLYLHYSLLALTSSAIQSSHPCIRRSISSSDVTGEISIILWNGVISMPLLERNICM